MVDPDPNQIRMPSDTNYSNPWVQIQIDESLNDAQDKEKTAEI
jgi:hypothetical protein